MPGAVFSIFITRTWGTNYGCEKSLTGNQQSQLTWDRRIPPLESGNRLSWHEFERRYDAMPHLKKAELIEGVVYVPSPLLRIMPNRVVI